MHGVYGIYMHHITTFMPCVACVACMVYACTILHARFSACTNARLVTCHVNENKLTSMKEFNIRHTEYKLHSYFILGYFINRLSFQFFLAA